MNQQNSYTDESIKTVHNYFNTLLKLRKNRLNLYFNKTCSRRNIIPKYIQIVIRNKTRTAQIIKQKAEKAWLSKTIQQLYTRIDSLTIKVYNLQLKIAKDFHYMEYKSIISNIDNRIQKLIIKKSRTIKKKLKSFQYERSGNEEYNIPIKHKFYDRINNLTNIELDNDERKLLEKGLKYNLPKKHNNMQQNKQLLEIENAILKSEIHHQSEIRTIITEEIAQNNSTTRINTKDDKIVKKIKNKLVEHNAIITKADKGSTTVIINNNEYKAKIDEYINENDIIELNGDPTNEYQMKIKRIINESRKALTQSEIFHNKLIKPTAPKIRGLPKIHKNNIPIRPLINFTTAPTYRIAKHINKWLNQNLIIENDHSVKNNIELVNKIETIFIPPTAKLVSFDITSMYSNIPVEHTMDITRKLLIKNNIEKSKTDEIINIIKEITNQNYFEHNNKFYSQTEGLAMGCPISGTLANIYLNHIENEYILNDKNVYKNNIIYWHRYVDDIILLFHGTNRQLDKLCSYINNIHQKIKFTMEIEKENQLNFLDLTIKKHNNKHEFKIFRKPTQTDHTINNQSYHPFQHKIAAYNHMVNRLNNIPMKTQDYLEELNTIKYIACKNGYNSTLIDNINKKYKNKKERQNLTTLNNSNEHQNQMKYICMEYNKDTQKILNKTFKKYGYKMAFKTNNKIAQNLNTKQQDNKPKDTGVYKLLCNDCPKFYYGQSGRSFNIRFKEHIREIGKPNIKSNYASHLTNEMHTYTDMETNMKIIHKVKKGQMLDRLEELEIYKNKDNPHMLNDKVNTRNNKIYDMILNN